MKLTDIQTSPIPIIMGISGGVNLCAGNYFIGGMLSLAAVVCNVFNTLASWNAGYTEATDKAIIDLRKILDDLNEREKND